MRIRASTQQRRTQRTALSGRMPALGRGLGSLSQEEEEGAGLDPNNSGEGLPSPVPVPVPALLPEMGRTATNVL